MKYLRQILLIALFSFLGELCRALIPVPIPASIYGMILLFAALSLKIISVGDVKDAGNFLTTFLPVLFIAPVVSLLDCWQQIKSHILAILFIAIFTTIVCFAISGWVTQWLMQRKEDKTNG